MEIRENETFQRENLSQRYEVLQELGDCYCSVGNYDEAQRHYEKAALLDADAAGPYVGLGIVALQKGLVEDSQIAFRVACRLDPDCSKAYCGLGLLAQQREDYKGAFDMYLRSLDLDTDNLTALLGLFQSSCQMGSFSKVIGYLEKYLDAHPADCSVMFSLAALYMKDGRLDESRKLLSDVVALDAGHDDAVNLLEEVEHCLAQKKAGG